MQRVEEWGKGSRAQWIFVAAARSPVTAALASMVVGDEVGVEDAVTREGIRRNEGKGAVRGPIRS